MELAEHLEDPRDLAPCGRLPPGPARLLQEGAEVSVPGVLEGQAVQRATVVAHQREAVEHLNGPRVPVEQLAEVRLAKPAVHDRAGLDAQDLGDAGNTVEPPGEVDLAEPAEAEHPSDPVPDARLGASDGLVLDQERRRRGP
jgi:hypothetical protein